MIATYKYRTEFNPPAPVIAVRVAHVATGVAVDDFPAQVDPGADRSVIPESLVSTLGLLKLDHILVRGFLGEPVEMSRYVAQVTPKGLHSVEVAVLTSTEERVMILGRDVLNHFRVVLDGPNQTVEIS
jgi:predicted aspartyl protease